MNIVGHRGLPESYPENTLIAIRAALETGAHGVEIDLQFSADGEPYVLHDDSFKRTAGVDANILDLNSGDIDQISVHEPARFAETFSPCLISHLQDMVELCRAYPFAVFFLEIKDSVFSRFTRSEVLARVMDVIEPVREQCAIISYDYELIELTKTHYRQCSGWVLASYDAASLSMANDLKPDFLICNKTKLPEGPLHAGNWAWFVYDVVDPQELEALANQGVTWLESWDVRLLLAA